MQKLIALLYMRQLEQFALDYISKMEVELVPTYRFPKGCQFSQYLLPPRLKHPQHSQVTQVYADVGSVESRLTDV